MDELIIALSEDAWQGDAVVAVTVDGGAPMTATVQALHGQGQAQGVSFAGAWGNAAHSVVVTFTNDQWGGLPQYDRNAYVLGASYNGTWVPVPPTELSRTGSATTIQIPATTPAAPVPAGPVPMGPAGTFTLALDATFGNATPGATVTRQADLFGPNGLAYSHYIYGPAATNPTNEANGVAIIGPVGDGCDGLYGNYRSRHHRFAEGSPQDVHVIGPDRITLKAWCGLYSGNAADCADGQIESGIMRFTTPLRPGCVVEIKCIMPKGHYSWPAFWLNPGQQAPCAADGTPAPVASLGWPPEIDVFDNCGYDDQQPGYYLNAGTPTNGDDAAYAWNGGTGWVDLPPTFQTTAVTTGWSTWLPPAQEYAYTVADQTADWHVYGLDWGADNVLTWYLDGVPYRARGYTWPASSPPAHLIASLQIGPKFNDLSGITPQAGLPNGWDWPIAYVRAWTRVA
jgi:hypothetical protein